VENRQVTEKAEKSSGKAQIARAASTVMLAFVLSNVIGLVRQILVARAFGADADLDAFYIAGRLPEILFSLIAGGALASAFVPTFTSLLENKKGQQAWALASSIWNLVTLVIAAASALAWLLSPQLVSLMAPEFAGLQRELTIELLRIQLLTPLIFSLSGLLMSILNAHQSFLLPAIAPSMYWLGMIFGVLAFVPSMGIQGLAWGAVLGAGLHLAVQIPALLRLKPQYSLQLGLGNTDVREVARLMAPRLLGVAAVQINFLVNNFIASGLPEGSVTGITVAFQVMTMPQVVIAQAIAIAALPTFSAQVSAGKLGEFRSSLAGTLRGVLLLSLPASVGLVLLRKPIVALLFQRGEFGPEDTQLVAWALLWFGVGLLGHSVVEIISRAFYALHDTKTPVFASIGAMGLNVILSLTLIANGLAMAAIGSALMGAGLWWWMSAFGSGDAWIAVIGGIVLGGIIFGAFVWIAKVPEFLELLQVVQKRLSAPTVTMED
jgi:putative peptidoglycan lipid II flippase